MVSVGVHPIGVADQQYPLPDVELSTCKLPFIQQIRIRNVLLNHLILVLLTVFEVNSFVIFP